MALREDRIYEERHRVLHPELVATYQSGCNPNLLDNAAFRDTDHLGGWSERSQYRPVADDDPYAHIEKGGQNGRNYYRDRNTRRYSESQWKEMLQQVVWDGVTIRKLKPSTWYTLSFWSRLGVNAIWTNVTSSNNGFAEQKLYLFSGHQYRLVFNGRISSTALNKGKELRVFVYNKEWTWSTSGFTNSTSDKSITVDFTVPSDGEYLLQGYLYPGDSDRGSVDYGTATLNWVRVSDKGAVLDTYVYPSCVDTSVQGYVDGVATSLGSDAACGFSLNAYSWEFEKHTITFKTKSYYSPTKTFADTEYVLFRLLPAPMSGEQVQADICMPKLGGHGGHRLRRRCRRPARQRRPYAVLCRRVAVGCVVCAKCAGCAPREPRRRSVLLLPLQRRVL